MFKKDIQPSTKSKLKSSIQRSIRQSILSTYPLLAPHIDEILPKKASLSSMKLPDRATLYVIESTPLFFQSDGPGHPPLIPHLRLVHRFPAAFPSIRIDRGAIRFVLSGATLMAPGLTSKGGRLPLPRDPEPVAKPVPVQKPAGEEEEEEEEEEEGETKTDIPADEEGRWGRELELGEVAVVMAEGKEEACAVGLLVMGTKDIKDKGKGPVMEQAHFLGDGLWNMATD